MQNIPPTVWNRVTFRKLLISMHPVRVQDMSVNSYGGEYMKITIISIGIMSVIFMTIGQFANAQLIQLQKYANELGA